MSNIHLITGRAGEKHVSAADEGALNAAVFGSGQYVLNEGGKMAAMVVSNNAVRIADGAAMFHGRYIRLEGYEDLTIESGAQGTYRNDLIVIRYTKDTTANTESAKLVVIKGTANSTTAADPAYVSGNILEGAVQADMPLYRIPLDNVNIGTPVALYEMMETNIGGLNGKQDITNNLTTSYAMAEGDFFPYYDVSMGRNLKTTFTTLFSKIKAAISPTDIGAAASGHTHTLSSLGAAAATHASRHASGGADPITPAAIGAAELNSAGTLEVSQAFAQNAYFSQNTTLTANDMGKFIRVPGSATDATNITVTLPTPTAAGMEVEIMRFGTGTVTVKAPSGASIRGAGVTVAVGNSVKIANQYGVVAFKSISSSIWIVSGDVE